MLRTALKPRWLGLFAVLVGVLVACAELGLWQLSVARNEASVELLKAAPQQPVVPLADLTGPHAPFPDEGSGRRVTVTGTYAEDRQLLVGPRRLDGVTGWWVVTPLVESGSGSGSGSWAAVVRGFAADPAKVQAPPTGTVTLTGSLAPAESPAETVPALPTGLPADAAPAGVAGSVDLAALVNQWPGDLYNLFLFGLDEQADGSAVTLPAGVERVPPPVPDTGINWRNAAYALQWWVFGLFAAWMWWRMVQDDHRADRAAQAALDDDTPDPAPTDERQEALT